MNQSTSDASSIQFNLPPLSLSLFDAEPSTHDQPNGVVHGSIPKHSSEPSTPTSSGYVAERGSSSTATSISHEIEELNIHDPPPSVSNDSDASLLPSQGNLDEDDASISWRKRKKHFFVLSHSGKPIYSRYGDEHKLAGFSATLQAIISFVENGSDRVKLVRAGKHQVVFLVKGPIYLVCISCTEEPYESLRGQLDLIYGQMIVILTKSVNRCFEKNPKFDMTPLLGGTDTVFSSLIHSFSWNPATFLHAYTCLPLAYATRQAAGAILQDVADSGVLFAILMCRHKVISLFGAQKASLHPDDMLLLANFVMSTESFRTSEAFSPVCLPRYNPLAFLYAYIHYFDDDTYLLLLTTNSDAFHHLKDCRIRIESVLLKSNVLGEVQRSLFDGGMRVEDLPPLSHSGSCHLGQHRLQPDYPERLRESNSGVAGVAGLWHFIYRSTYLDQYVSSEFSSPINTPQKQKRLFRAYQKLFASMHEKGIGPHKTQFKRDENYVLLCWVTQDFELYAAFDPLAEKASSIKTCNRVCQWVKDVENEIFLLGGSPFSW
ncbi:vacuolar fusion protein MON1 homolog isoform X1 [Trifolium pratense]|uniref:vacuolar fusion protein MON1 homolog isoform X1 n=1 Tax=Trifolium pratense TaxID=57577 RepID=UPI001E694BE1|nr:vacuolar fusion protein MON1 homolog isoform X1 [Trifolium pratense]XP_045805019.1 vacuolar fusion protein MON1 homolog isoform X1 [Trifolium pratense]XP_045805020.1 vacuolar fusion protein MON1 homolog isoform X1 [Trifolium pratense]